MLHRYLLTLSLVLTFGLGQLGLLTHDISHLNQHLSVDAIAQSSVTLQQSLNTDSSLDVAREVTSAQKSTFPNPLSAEQHTCEKCVGFSNLLLALQQATITVNLPSTAIAQSNTIHAFHYELPALHRLARAPPYSLA